MAAALHIIAPWDDDSPFPPPAQALREPPGLIAVGGSLRPRRLLAAYRRGIFPWYGEGEPILWWSPDPRCVLFPFRLHIAHRLARRMRQQPFTITRDCAFRAVVEHCAEPRADEAGTWILPEMVAAYTRMHELGHATSFECWSGERLVGGLYGVRLGHVLFGESMFSRATDASKFALAAAARAPDVELIDCQFATAHLERMGAESISRPRFLALLAEHGAPRHAPGDDPPGHAVTHPRA